MMTSNRPLEDWGKLIGDVPSATAILDRFLHHAEIVQITGKSYRLRNQERGKEGGEEPKGNGAASPLPFPNKPNSHSGGRVRKVGAKWLPCHDGFGNASRRNQESRRWWNGNCPPNWWPGPSP
jgi:hypothetical protein